MYRMRVQDGKICITWAQYDLALDTFCLLLKKRVHEFDGVYGISPGGLVPAVCLHYRLDLPLNYVPTKKSLIVNDVNDVAIHSYVNNYYVYTVICREEGRTPDQHSFLIKENDPPIVLPWEKKAFPGVVTRESSGERKDAGGGTDT